MKYLTIACAIFLLVASRAHAESINFSGIIGNNGTFLGQVDYDPVVAGWNLRGLSPNVSYSVSDYNVTVRPSEGVLPEVLNFSNAPGQSIELCSGQCVFGYQPVNNLLFTEPGYRLQLSFTPDWTTLLAAPSRLQWNPDGKFYDSMLLVRSDQPGVYSGSVPELTTWMMLVLGLAIVLYVRKKLHA